MEFSTLFIISFSWKPFGAYGFIHYLAGFLKDVYTKYSMCLAVESDGEIAFPLISLFWEV